jgi:rhodanese-related sulfurtransferase/uncharacterized membrane protein YedE/YeeE
MGPLEGLNIISAEFDFILALLIGIAFGFVLEQAGFSSSKRLAGLFYGTDFVVLRVFFTAAITTIIGVIILDYVGFLDSSLIFINPTFLGSAIVGGVIMGLGFIMGGFCPGTSVCAAAIGKIDAIVFVGGLFIGVFLFAELYPLYEGFYHGSSYGDIKIFDTLGMSKAWFVFILVFIALFAFVVTYFIEQKVTKKPIAGFFQTIKAMPYHSIAVFATLIITLFVINLPDRKTKIVTSVKKEMIKGTYTMALISAEELSFKILETDENIKIVDVRPDSVFAKLSIPGASNIPADRLFDRAWEDYLGNIKPLKIFVAQNERQSIEAALIAKKLGYKNIAVLKGGMNSFVTAILNYKNANIQDDTQGFIAEASVRLKKMIAKNKQPKIKCKVLMKAKGGC